MFCGAGVRAENVRSLPAGSSCFRTSGCAFTSYFRMPFWRSAHVSLVNRQSKRTGPVTASIHLAPQRYPENDAAYFCALYHDGRTEMGRDWLFCDAVGTGWLVGVVQTMEGDHYCEGNEHFIMDGTGMPQIIGTGTEDYYLRASRRTMISTCLSPAASRSLDSRPRILLPLSSRCPHSLLPVARRPHPAWRKQQCGLELSQPWLLLCSQESVNAPHRFGWHCSFEESERAHGYSAPGSKVTERSNRRTKATTQTSSSATEVGFTMAARSVLKLQHFRITTACVCAGVSIRMVRAKAQMSMWTGLSLVLGTTPIRTPTADGTILSLNCRPASRATSQHYT